MTGTPTTQAVTDDSTGFAAEWQRWHAQRDVTVAAPGGSLTLTGTHWLSAATRIDGLPGTWSEEGSDVRVTGAQGLTVDGEPVNDGLLHAGQRLAVGDVELAIIKRGEDIAVRTFDPNAAAVAAFGGIDAFAPDPAWMVAGEFRPADPDGTIHINHSNSEREADYPIVGTFAFSVAGADAELVAIHTGKEGQAHITFRDATSGRSTYGPARFLFLPLPPAAGPVTLDFNRTVLPPCAFSDAFICPLPPAQNVLPFEINAGEKQVLTRCAR
ncbi:DUF1684 domain-containing protein [Actinopolymorpha alba]|uniref:DUF1684 domain-containing protein n=1 Tax=Actinopolymorpha alba TaxID=533267 RepID=UPI0003612A20|nr:DUF1684 domain-containing protein [Actinopolymorpha alba]